MKAETPRGNSFPHGISLSQEHDVPKVAPRIQTHGVGLETGIQAGSSPPFPGQTPCSQPTFFLIFEQIFL